MNKLFIATAVVGCLWAPHGHALEAVAQAGNGAGSANGATLFALGNQVSNMGAVNDAQSAMLQQLQSSVSSLTTQVSQLIDYITHSSCPGGTLAEVDGGLTCTGQGGGTGNTGNTSGDKPKGCVLPAGFGTSGVMAPHGDVVVTGGGAPSAFTTAGGATQTCTDGMVVYQCQNGVWKTTLNTPGRCSSDYGNWGY